MLTEAQDKTDRDLVVYVDGDYVPSEQAAVSIFDHGFLYGDGVFDTLCVWKGNLFRASEHIERLLHSAHATKMNFVLSKDEILKAIIETVQQNRLQNAYVKVIITRGVSPEPLLDPQECRSSLFIFARPFLWLINPTKIEAGIKVKIVSTRRIPAQSLDPKIKSLNYQNNALAKIEANEAGVDDAILLDLEGYVCEGPTYNIFTAKDDQLYTPQDNILLGVTRQVVTELAARDGYITNEARLTPYDLYTADEVFFCSTAGGIIPIVQVDGRNIGTGVPGSITRRLTDSYFATLEHDGHNVLISE